MASSSSSSSFISNHEKNYYHVFISFRGEDTRRNFTSHLCTALLNKRIKIYVDEHNLKKGDEISPSLLKAIEESKISVIVLSENYASSSWCLNELNHILRCKEKTNQLVVPIFYHVDPSNVRNQHGSFANAFAAHEERFKEDMNKVHHWRKSLTDVANLSGFHISNAGYESDSVLIEKIVEDIMNKLNCILPPSDDFEDLFGIDKHIEKMESLLSIGSKDIQVVGIWGMGGLGKTTLAHAIFYKLSPHFQGSKFLENVKDEVKKHQPTDLQKEVFSELLGEKQKLKKVSQLVKDRLRSTKVLLVLDDVDHVDQFERLANRNWFDLGSRILVTTRDVQILRNIKADEIYNLKEMNTDDAFRLFYSKAFQGEPEPNYIELSERVVAYAKGNPLALKVLGAGLCSKSTEEWESELDKLKSIPNQAITDVLAISYYGLSSNRKCIFLDIACFFPYEPKSFLEEILSCRYSGVVMEISTLIDKSLITIINNDEILMHDLLRDMGREIVRGESIDDPGRRSRLCYTKDVCHVLENNLGTREVQGMSLYFPETIEDLTLEPLVFKNMCNLRYLKFYGDDDNFICKINDIPENLQLPDTLIFLCWDGFSMKSLPQKFMPKNLIYLHMYKSSLEQLGNGVKFKKLKILNLESSKSLTPIDLSCAPNLEDINVSDCSRMDKFPLFPNPCNIKDLDMGGTSIEEVPPSIECFTFLTNLWLDECTWLKTLPTNIFKLKYLKLLSLYDCSEFEYFPEILEPMECLLELDLTNTGIRELPVSIEKLTCLKSLYLENCKVLEIIPYTICNLHSLETFFLCSCSKLVSLPELPFFIKEFDASGCTSLFMVSNSLNAFTQGPPDDFVEQELIFYNCFELDDGNMVTEFYIRVLRATISKRKEFKSNRFPGVGICFPGAEIPEWFNSRSEGSLVNMKLDEGWYNANFVGFALCAVYSFGTNDVSGDSVCEMCFKTEHGESQKKIQRCIKIVSSATSEHVVMRFVDLDYSDISGAVEVSFEFRHEWREPGDEMKNEDYVVKMCGIRMLYVKDVEKFQVSNSQYPLDESNVVISEAERSGSGTIDFGITNNQCQLRSNNVEYFKNLRELNLPPSKTLPTLIDLFSAHVFFTPRNIKCLCVSGITIEEVPPSIECFSFLTTLWLDECTNLKTLPANIFKLKSLKSLSLYNCSEFEYFPEILEPMECLLELDLMGTRIRELPLSIKKLTCLKSLYLESCKMLEIIPPTIYNLHLLEFLVLDCTGLKSLPELPFSLKEFDASGCTALTVLSKSRTVLTQDPANDIVEQEFLFCNCTGLDDINIVTEFQIRIFSATLVSSLEHQELKSKLFRKVGMCFPGAEIPEWFIFKFEGSSVNMKLHEDWYNSNFMGFALCAIFTSGETKVPGDLICTMFFKTEQGEICDAKTLRCIKIKAGAMFEHVVMRSVDVEYFCDISSVVEVSFYFNYQEHEFLEFFSDEIRVVRCGIQMLYIRDAMEFCSSNGEYLLRETNVVADQPGPSEGGTIDFDTDEPHQKEN